MDCPDCKAPDLHRETALLGLGYIIEGPYGCESCGWSEIDKYNQLLGNGGEQPDGSYVDVYGCIYPKGARRWTICLG